MKRISLTVIQPNLEFQQYSCHGCGDCCRDFTVQLGERDLEKLREQQWAQRLGFEPFIEFRGEKYLRQREDGACVFLMDNGLCRIHAEFGFEEKPIACQVFPFHFTPVERGALAGINFACQSVRENKGADLRTHLPELRRMVDELEEISPAHSPPMLTAELGAQAREVRDLVDRFDAWMRRPELSLEVRLDGLWFVISSLSRATLNNVREKRFADLLDTLFGALPDELSFHPVERPGRGARRMLRQAAFARTEDPKVGRIERTGRARTVISQLWRSRRFVAGRGRAPLIGLGWPAAARLQHVEGVGPATDPRQVEQIDELMTRWIRASLLGGRAWGYGYYFWPIVDGLQAMLLNVIVVGWLARLHALGREVDDHEAPSALTIDDVRAAISRVDRTAGRARWLGGPAEQLRLRYFRATESMRPLLHAYTVTAPGRDESHS